MFLVQIAGATEKLTIDADTFKVKECHEFVYFYKGDKAVALLRTDSVRAIANIHSLSDIG